MDFYALYPCTITDLEAVKAAEKKENVYCEHLKERIRKNNEEELDGQFFHGNQSGSCDGKHICGTTSMFTGRLCFPERS